MWWIKAQINNSSLLQTVVLNLQDTIELKLWTKSKSFFYQQISFHLLPIHESIEASVHAEPPSFFLFHRYIRSFCACKCTVLVHFSERFGSFYCSSELLNSRQPCGLIAGWRCANPPAASLLAFYCRDEIPFNKIRPTYSPLAIFLLSVPIIICAMMLMCVLCPLTPSSMGVLWMQSGRHPRRTHPTRESPRERPSRHPGAALRPPYTICVHSRLTYTLLVKIHNAPMRVA